MTDRLGEYFLALSRRKKAAILISADIIFSQLALWAAFSLRLGEFYQPTGQIYYAFLAAPIIVIPIFIRLGLYRAIIRYIGIRALWTIVQATTLYALLFATFVFHLGSIGIFPRTVPALNWMIMLLLVGGSRFLGRWWLSDSYFQIAGLKGHRDYGKKNVVIYGAGNAGAQLASALIHGREFKAVAFIDDDLSLQKQKINDLKIYGLSSLNFLINRYKITDVLLAIPSVSHSRRSDIIRVLETYPVHVRSVPGINEIANGKITFDAIQEVDIADLLGRDSVPPHVDLLHANIRDKVVMVTGAGGSIGSELCRQIIVCQPACLVLFEVNEFQLYSIHQTLIAMTASPLEDWQSSTSAIKIVPILGSITHQKRVEQVCAAFAVQTIYHAAAYKHVPLVEQNPGEAIWNNIFGTLRLAQAAIATQVETFVLISTDKAVRPTNTMGATKRFAELILQALSQDAALYQKTRFTMVRFGNVLGSSGSVVPLFRQQIAKGGPVTVTDARIIRYFMTIPEAADLVIQAGAMGQGGDVFVLDMGEPVRIVDLAKRMIRLSGFEVKSSQRPHGDIEIVYTGLRPGEKLYEELLIGDTVSQTCHEKIMRAEERVIAWRQLTELLADLEHALNQNNFEFAREVLKQAVTGFAPQCEVVDEVSLALQKTKVFKDKIDV
jgi:FlaA1/EpsC-like NDP-sugar epimerase